MQRTVWWMLCCTDFQLGGWGTPHCNLSLKDTNKVRPSPVSIRVNSTSRNPLLSLMAANRVPGCFEGSTFWNSAFIIDVIFFLTSCCHILINDTILGLCNGHGLNPQLSYNIKCKVTSCHEWETSSIIWCSNNSLSAFLYLQIMTKIVYIVYFHLNIDGIMTSKSTNIRLHICITSYWLFICSADPRRINLLPLVPTLIIDYLH